MVAESREGVFEVAGQATQEGGALPLLLLSFCSSLIHFDSILCSLIQRGAWAFGIAKEHFWQGISVGGQV